tara:strand:+ start:26 stop:853 length:828 start_codon:yes stop_codon:yes gene_type:complete
MLNALGNYLTSKVLSSDRLLDEFSGAAAGYSLQRISKSATNVIRARREADNAEQDFTAEEIFAGDLDTWASSTNAYVTTWYDQSGNGQHATQTTSSLQPKVIDNGSVILDSNGYAAIEFDGSDDFMQMPFAAGSNSGYLISTVCDPNNNTTNQNLIDFRDVNNDGISLLGLSSGVIHARTDTVDATKPYSGSADLWTGEFTGSNVTAYVNGSGGTSLSGLNTSATTNGRIGSPAYSVSSTWNGKLSEVVIYLTDQSSNRSNIESNIAGRYGITLS